MTRSPPLSRPAVLSLAILAGWACAPEEEVPDAPPSACGDPVYDLTVRFDNGLVVDEAGAGLADAAVVLEDRSFQPAKILGSATTGGDGAYTFSATDVTSWPGCWLTLLDYRIVVETPERYGELEVNRYMYDSIEAGTFVVDLTDHPITASPDGTTDETLSGSACGDPVYGIEIDFQGLVTDKDGAPAAGVEIVLEDREILPATVRGTATTGADGRFTLRGSNITSWPDCWLTLLDYRLYAQTTDGTGRTIGGELQVNKQMWESIQAGSYRVDVAASPIVLTRAGAR